MPAVAENESTSTRLCFSCGSEVRANATRCPTCHRRPFLDAAPTVRDVDTGSIVALVLAVGWFFWVGSALGVLLGYSRLREIDSRPDDLWGRPLATGAIIAGWAGLATLVLAAMYLGLRLAFHYLVN